MTSKYSGSVAVTQAPITTLLHICRFRQQALVFGHLCCSGIYQRYIMAKQQELALAFFRAPCFIHKPALQQNKKDKKEVKELVVSN